MNDLEYQQQAAVTLSHEFHGERVGVFELQTKLQAAIVALNELDVLKKLIFYGRGAQEREPIAERSTICNVFLTQQDETMFHCLLGIATEAGEGLEQLFTTIQKRQYGTVEGQQWDFDTVNIVEESGDAFWYHANLANVLGANMGEWKTINISKLRKRFKDKFDAAEANNRDLTAEREVLKSKNDILYIQQYGRALRKPFYKPGDVLELDAEKLAQIKEKFAQPIKAESFKVDGVELAKDIPNKDVSKPVDLYAGHSSLADMIAGHIVVWRGQLVERQIQFQRNGDSDNASYCEHELKALDEIERATKHELGNVAGWVDPTKLLRDALKPMQTQATNRGFKYWNSLDDQGLTCTVEQARELLQDLLCIQVEIKKD